VLEDALANNDNPDEVKKSVQQALGDKELFQAYARAYLSGYMQARDAQRSVQRGALSGLMDEARTAPGVSKKSQVGGKGGSIGGGNISVGEERKFQNLTAGQMVLGALLITSNAQNNGVPASVSLQNLSDGYLKTMVNKARRYSESEPYKAPFGREALASIIQRDNHALKASIPFRADEINASNIAGQGTEWLGTFYSTEVWLQVRLKTHFGTMLSKGMWEQEIPQGNNTAYFPTEGADPIAYATKEANDLASGRIEAAANIGFIGTGRVQCTPGELKLATGVTTILQEDSIINTVQQTERQLQLAAEKYIDKLMLNGDTETGANTNINLIDGTPASGVTTTPYYIASNGFRKLPLVTATAYSVDALAALSLANYRATFGLLDKEVRQDKAGVAFLVDSDTHLASWAIAEIATEDVRRSIAPTITSGNVLQLYGIDVLEAGYIELANAAGKVPAAGGTLGSILAAYAPYWGVGWKRRITLETGRDIYSGADIYVMSMRLGFVPRGNTAAAISFNVAV